MNLMYFFVLNIYKNCPRLELLLTKHTGGIRRPIFPRIILVLRTLFLRVRVRFENLKRGRNDGENHPQLCCTEGCIKI